MYANEGFRDNTKYLYDYLIENHYNDYYKIVCSTNDYKEYRDIPVKNVRFVSTLRGVVEYLSSRHVFYSFGRIPIVPAKQQRVIQMWHGTSFKGFDQSTRKTNTKKNQFYTYVFASSEFFVPIVEKKFACRREYICICGHPRTDRLYREDIVYDLGQYRKIIIWLPTFRKSSAMGYADVRTDNIVPFFKTEELRELDACLKEWNVGLIIKLHPLQDVTDKAAEATSNLRLLTHKQFQAAKYDLYSLLRQTDALITDYSSVFYDYLLLNRPIGFTEDDEEEYRRSRGFAIDNPDDFKPGMRIASRDELLKFIENVVSGKDDYMEKRKRINDLANQYQDGRNCERALAAAGIGKQALNEQ